MKMGSLNACAKTGFFLGHAKACEQVAEWTNCIILFREPGVMAEGLIAEHYSMKGFRIDTKSCNWGPMAGFVCADPRLTKDPVYAAADKNPKWTHEALSGHIVEKWFGKVEDPEWKANVMPIAISKDRIEQLKARNVIHPRLDTGSAASKSVSADFVGESRAPKGDTVLYWRLVPAGGADQWWLKDRGQRQANYYVLCVDTQGAKPFRQQYPDGVEPIRFKGHETILGLINPGTTERGFKACVTADYDLFAIWPGTGAEDRMARQHELMGDLRDKMQTPAPLPGGVARMPGVDTRLQKGGHREHHRFGDVSARTMNVKVLLNSALQGRTGYQGGNAIHHNDEAGNFALAKGTLADCLPLIGFMPESRTGHHIRSAGFNTVLVETLADFRELVLYARSEGFREVVKPSWLGEAGITA